MKWIAYNILFALAFPLMLPGFLVRMLRRGGYRARMGDRFAIYPRRVVERFSRGNVLFGHDLRDCVKVAKQNNGFVWIHAVSVGEVQVAGQLMREWRKVEPEVRFCFSTTSSTGWKMAERELGERDELIYNPLDFPSFVKGALALVRPRAVVLTESEIWPVFVRAAKRCGAGLFLINARVSDRSAPRYAKARWLFKDVFCAFDAIFAQSDIDRNRLVAAGAPAEKITVSGSFKFDVARRIPAKEAELREWLGESASARILLGGSTWPGEDQALLRIYSRLRQEYGSKHRIVLVIAPRHFEKADEVEANIRKYGFACVRRSREVEKRGVGGQRCEDSAVHLHLSSPPVYLADTTGELMGLYGIADFVFVGKSLSCHGGQNMIEPCLCGKPTVVGPNTENFRPVMSDLLAARGIVQVDDEGSLERTICDWFENGDDGLGERAAQAVRRRLGVVSDCVASIREAMK